MARHANESGRSADRGVRALCLLIYLNAQGLLRPATGHSFITKSRPHWGHGRVHAYKYTLQRFILNIYPYMPHWIITTVNTHAEHKQTN